MVILLTSSTIISEQYFKKDIAFWTGFSGFTKLDKSIEIVNLIGIVVSTLLLLPIIYLSFSNNIYLSLTIVNISTLLALLQLYFGINLFAFPNNFINQLLPQWENKLNSLDVVYMEMKFWCCGFQFRHQFFGDNCTISPLPCASQLVSFLSPTIKATGKTFFYHSVINFIVAISVFYLSKPESEIRAESHNYKKITIHQQETQQNSLMPAPDEEIPFEDSKADREIEDITLKDVPIEELTTSSFKEERITTEMEKKPLKQNSID